MRTLRVSIFWWLGAESNRRHADFQSAALPTELPSHFSILHQSRSEIIGDFSQAVNSFTKNTSKKIRLLLKHSTRHYDSSPRQMPRTTRSQCSNANRHRRWVLGRHARLAHSTRLLARYRQLQGGCRVASTALPRTSCQPLDSKLKRTPTMVHCLYL